MANFAAAGLDGLVRILKRKLKNIQYRPPARGRATARLLLCGRGLAITLAAWLSGRYI